MKRLLTLIVMMTTCLSLLAVVKVGGKQANTTGTTTFKSTSGVGITEGYITYDADTKTLTLDNVKMQNKSNSCILINGEAVTILLKGSNEITTYYMHCFELRGNTTIEGADDTSKLTVSSIYSEEKGYLYNCISCYGCDLTIKKCSLEVYGEKKTIITGNGNLYVNASDITVHSDDQKPISFSSVSLTRCSVTSHPNAKFSSTQGGFVDKDNQKIVGDFQISCTEYPIRVAGRQITGRNMDDVLGDGTVSLSEYAEYLNLYLKDANINVEDSKTHAITTMGSLDKKLYITSKGNNVLTTPAAAIYLQNKNVILDGDGTLSLSGNSNLGVVCVTDGCKQLTFDGRSNLQLTAKSANSYGLNILSSNTLVTCRGASLTFKSGNKDCSGVRSAADIILDGCFADSWSYLDNSSHYFYDENGSPQSEVSILPGTDFGVKLCNEYLNSYNLSTVSTFLYKMAYLQKGTISYNEKDESLVFDNVKISSKYSTICANKDVNITAKGTNYIESTGTSVPCIDCGSYNLTIQKSPDVSDNYAGQLSISSTGSDAVCVTANKLTINSTKVDINAAGNYAIKSSGGIRFYNSQVTAKSQKDIICSGCPSLDLDLCYLYDHDGIFFNTTTCTLSHYSVDLKNTEMVVNRGYGIRIGGQDLTLDAPYYKSNPEACRYYPASNVLRLTNFSHSTSNEDNMFIACKDLTIELVGENTLNNGHDYNVFLSTAGDVTINGEGSLTMKQTNGKYAMELYHTNVTIKDTEVSAYSKDMSAIVYTLSSMTIDHATLTATSGNPNRPVILSLNSKLSMMNAKYANPDYYTKNGEAYYYDYENYTEQYVSSEVKIIPVDSDLKVAGVMVSSSNMNHILYGTGQKGSASYDFSTNTLTLKDVNIKVSGLNAIEAKSDIIIKLVGENNITVTDDYSALYLMQNATIMNGIEGVLNIHTDSYQSVCAGNLTIKDCEVNVVNDGTYGLAGNNFRKSELNIINAKVTTQGNGGSASNWAAITLTDCEITSPANVQITCDDYPQGFTINGKICKDKVVIEPSLVTISDITALIDRYLSNDSAVTIGSITELIDKYLNQ